ncbi:Putative hypothetical protein [Helicobacter mustelae 12198]|uniref:Uncharacterized protein n=1 Tax=Helicobacter mustelae (strain ATCC 43772 / CCUG 25715 / CIP 103759 / LMG 18044 / NCTC 12198 / R85-136P) TaxID=679897 RepID=D3UIZ0_HELM1|nr:Putative hypothetical protein [Helicobacter mustelae 12198]
MYRHTIYDVFSHKALHPLKLHRFCMAFIIAISFEFKVIILVLRIVRHYKVGK